MMTMIGLIIRNINLDMYVHLIVEKSMLKYQARKKIIQIFILLCIKFKINKNRQKKICKFHNFQFF